MATDSVVKVPLSDVVSGCLEAHTGLLLFGGGIPKLATIDGTVIAAHQSVDLSNDAGTVTLLEVSGPGEPAVLDTFTWPISSTALAGESYVRDPDGYGEMVAHSIAVLALEGFLHLTVAFQ